MKVQVIYIHHRILRLGSSDSYSTRASDGISVCGSAAVAEFGGG